MKTLLAIVLSAGLFATVGFAAAPAITQVSSAASFSLDPLPNSAIAQGSFLAIFGSGLGTPASGCGTNLTDCIWKPYPLPTDIKGAEVNITVGSTTKKAYLFFAIDSQINAVVPSDTPTGKGTVTVSFNGQTSSAFPITVTANSFGTFAVNQSGTGPGIITDAKYQVLTPTHTAKPGDAVILWGTGLGPAPDVANEASAGPCLNACDLRGSNLSVNVWVGGQKADVAYAGRAPGITAEDQIVFTVPSGVQGCYVTVAVQAGPSSAQLVSNFTSMTVDPAGGTCQDADGINMNDIAPAIQSKGSANVGVISMLSNYLNLTGLLSVQWDNDTVNGLIGTVTSQTIDSFQGFTISPSVGNCTVNPFQQYPPPSDPGLASVTYIDAGSALNIQGPNGTKSIPKNSDGKGYGALVGGAKITDLIAGNGIPPFFLNSTFGIVPGTYTITGPGGSVVGAFSGTIPVSQAASTFKWTNPPSPTTPISRSQPLQINWTGGDPQGFVDITAIGSTTTSLIPSTNTPGVLVECIVPNTGSFTIPAYVMQSLPPSSAASEIAGELLVGPASGAVKISPTPSGLDAAYIFYHIIQGSNVVWQ